MRPPVAAFAAAVVAALGLAGLIRGAMPQQSAAVPVGTGASQPIVVTGAYVREPASPDVAAAYFTVYNTTGSPDTLQSVITGAGATAALHTGPDMTVLAGGLVVPAHSHVSLSPGKGHVMIEQLYGTLRPGQTVNLELQFAKAGPVVVNAPVIAIGAPAPTGGAPAPSSGPTK